MPYPTSLKNAIGDVTAWTIDDAEPVFWVWAVLGHANWFSYAKEPILFISGETPGVATV